MHPPLEFQKIIDCKGSRAYNINYTTRRCLWTKPQLSDIYRTINNTFEFIMEQALTRYMPHEDSVNFPKYHICNEHGLEYVVIWTGMLA